MISLDHLLPPPPQSKMTVGENDGILLHASSQDSSTLATFWMENQAVDVKVSQETARPAHSKYDAKEAFSAHKETLWQRMIVAYHKDGLRGAMEEIIEDEDSVSSYIVKVASLYINIHKYVEKLQSVLPMQHEVPTVPASVQFGGNNTTIVRIAWHRHTSILAVLFADDVVRIYGKGRVVTPVLKHRDQKNVTHMEWMPFSASVLALSCDSGILLWTLDPLSVVARPSGSCMTLLSHHSTLPAKSFTWHPKGIYMCCVGGKGKELVVWDTAKEDRSVVHIGSFTNLNYVLWSPDGLRVLVGMEQCAIKIFECRQWTYERYSLNEPLRTAVWSESGRILIFATISEPTLHAIHFEEDSGVGGSSVAHQVVDLTLSSLVDDDNEEVKVGGSVQCIAWDEQNERLAVVFTNTEFIALFHTYCYPQLHISPGGFIRGYPNEVPVDIAFQKSVNGGSILTTVWTSGLVKHIPIKYCSRQRTDFSFNASTTAISNLQGLPYQFNQSLHQSVTLNDASVLNTPKRQLFTSP